VTIIWATTGLEPEITEKTNFFVPSSYYWVTTLDGANINIERASGMRYGPLFYALYSIIIHHFLSPWTVVLFQAWINYLSSLLASFITWIDLMMIHNMNIYIVGGLSILVSSQIVRDWSANLKFFHIEIFASYPGKNILK
jgi:hypothetical protein